MTDLSKTLIAAVLDRSGSMSYLRSATEEGFDAFIAEQRTQPGDCVVTLAQFDTEYEVVYKDKPITDVPALSLVPRGGTALWDAIGKTIVTVGEALAKLPEDERPASVIFCILTDGQENASSEFTDLGVIKEMITEQTEKYSWLFKFFGADVSAIPTAVSMGIDPNHAIQYSGTNVRDSFSSASTSTLNYRLATTSGQTYAAASVGSAYTEEDRAKAQGKTKGSKTRK